LKVRALHGPSKNPLEMAGFLAPGLIEPAPVVEAEVVEEEESE
jgi:hypothetical protein